MEKSYKVKDTIVNLNNSIINFEKKIIAGNTNFSIPPIFIIGAPRSGTTLVNQIIASSFNIAYIDNISAKFWEAPSVGLSLSNEIIPFGKRKLASFNSSFGFTEEAIGPHEFGYFWQKWFKFSDSNEVSTEEEHKIEKQQLQKQVYSMTNVVNLPIIFKNTASLTFQTKLLSQIFPNALFIICRRDPLYNAQSLVQSRIKYNGSIDEWFSVKPKNIFEIEKKNPIEQVVIQLFESLQSINNFSLQFQKEKPHQIIETNYTQLCSHPEQLVNDLVVLFGKNNLGLGRKETSFNPFIPTDKKTLSNELFNQLKKSVKKYFV